VRRAAFRRCGQIAGRSWTQASLYLSPMLPALAACPC
jgi:hypothetical protein